MSAKDIEQVGDVVNGTNYHSGSAQDEYFKYKLLKEKLKLSRGDGNIINPQGLRILKATSEKDEIELQILEKLTNITESSPEFAQVVDITGTKDRYEQAKRLAETVYDRVRSEQVLSMYTPSLATLQGHFKSRSIESAVGRAQALNGLPGQAQGVPEAIAAALARLAGVGGA